MKRSIMGNAEFSLSTTSFMSLLSSFTSILPQCYLTFTWPSSQTLLLTNPVPNVSITNSLDVVAVWGSLAGYFIDAIPPAIGTFRCLRL